MNILFVCTGNTCRSPMAEYYLNSLRLPDIKVFSAGVYASGEPISEESAKVMEEIGINAADHISAPLTAEMIEKADRIYCMTPSHKALILSLGIDSGKVFLLKEKGVCDPFGGDTEIYRKCREEIISAINEIFCLTPHEVSYLNEEDAKSVAALEELCFNDPWSENAVRESMRGKNTFMGIKEKGQLAGYLSFFESCGEGYINNVAVAPTHRRQGLARALLCELMNYAVNRGLDFLTLEVRESNAPAIALYTLFGFKEEGRRKNYYSAPKEDAIILTRRF